MSVRLNLAGYAVTGATLVAFLAACATGNTPAMPTSPATVTATQTNTITVTATPSAKPSSTKPVPATSTPAPQSTFAFDKGLSGLRVHNPEDSSEYLVAIKLGPLLTNARVGMKAGRVKLGSVCPFSPSRDAVMQYTLLISSATSRDMAVWNLDVRPSTGKGTFPIVTEQFATNTGNLNCTGTGYSQSIYQNGGSFSPDGFREVNGYVIIPGYKTAAHPKAKLANSPLLLKVSGTVLGHSHDIGSKRSNGFYPLTLG